MCLIATRSEKTASTITRIFKGGPTMTLKRDDKSSAEKSLDSDVDSKSGEGASTTPISTRVGRNTVDIDVPALRHLVVTLKDKLKP
jgi:hypothetical protein